MLKSNVKDITIQLRFSTFSSVSVVNFEKVNVCWDINAVVYFEHKTILTNRSTCEKIPFKKSIKFGMPLNKSKICYK